MTQHDGGALVVAYRKYIIFALFRKKLNQRLLLNDQPNEDAHIQTLYDKLDKLVFEEELAFTALLPLLEVVLTLTRGKYHLFKLRAHLISF